MSFSASEIKKKRKREMEYIISDWSWRKNGLMEYERTCGELFIKCISNWNLTKEHTYEVSYVLKYAWIKLAFIYIRLRLLKLRRRAQWINANQQQP